VLIFAVHAFNYTLLQSQVSDIVQEIANGSRFKNSGDSSHNKRASGSDGEQESDGVNASEAVTTAANEDSAEEGAQHDINVTALVAASAAVHNRNETAAAALQRTCLLLLRRNSILEARLRQFQVNRLCRFAFSSVSNVSDLFVSYFAQCLQMQQAEQVDKNVNLLSEGLTLGQDEREARGHGATAHASHADSTAAARSPAMNAGETSIEGNPKAGGSGGGSGRGAEDQASAGVWSSEGLSAESISSRLAQRVNSAQAEAAKLKRLLDCGASCVLQCPYS
jgi:hypothetical protein